MTKTQLPMDYSMVGVRMPVDLREKLEALAAVTGHTPSAVIRALIRMAEPTHAPLYRLSTGVDTEDGEAL
jgi:hypothetical protein